MKPIISLVLITLLLITACVGNKAQTAAELLDIYKPLYPPLSMENGEQGRVELNVKIKADGSVAAAKVVQSSGFERLDNAALNVVTTKYQFKPALDEKGKAVKSRVIIPFSFELEK